MSFSGRLVAVRGGQPVKQPGLGEQGEAVGYSPVLDDPAVDDAGDIENGEVDRAVARWPEERPGCGTARPYPHPDGVALLDGVLDGEGHARRCPVDVADGGLDMLARLRAG